jgi:phospholipase/lecithinase/hemolysin
MKTLSHSTTKSMKTLPHLPRNSAGIFSGWRKLVFGVLALTVATVVFAGTGFSSIVVFGDSLSDTGRLFRLTHGGFPPRVAYFDGRQTNGAVWVEYLAGQLGLGCHLKNYAVVGATTGPSSDVPTGNVWSDTFTGLDGTSLSGQFARYLSDSGGKVDPAALYIVEGGANDLIDPLSALLLNPPATTAEFMQDVQEIATPIVVNLATIVGTLKALGAQHIAIVNVPDFGKAPRIVGFGPVASAVVSQVVQVVNGYVAAQLDGLDAMGGSKIARIDAFAFIDGVVAAPASFGFTNATGQFMTLDLPGLTVTFASANRCAVSQWFFWDDLHPTTRGHAFFAANALATLRAAFPDVHFGHEGCR